MDNADLLVGFGREKPEEIVGRLTFLDLSDSISSQTCTCGAHLTYCRLPTSITLVRERLPFGGRSRQAWHPAVRGSQEHYHREFSAFYPPSARRLESEDEQPMEGGSWSPSLPSAPSGLLERTTFTLTKREAKYLAERIWECGQTVFGELLSSANAEIDNSFVWETTFAAKLGPSLKSQIAQAQNFSELMHGAALHYNFMLACDAKRKLLQDEYRDELGAWAEMIGDAKPRYESWDCQRFWKIVSESTHFVSPPARKFVDDWIDHTLRSGKLGSIAEDPTAQSLIAAREAQVKRTRKRHGNPRALERWNEASGAGQIDYRWFRVKTIAGDIRQGLA
jgi:hypothetical protein